MTELEINNLKAALVKLQTDLGRMTAWAQVLANAGTTYKRERDEARAALAVKP
jgi:hypothetical protein